MHPRRRQLDEGLELARHHRQRKPVSRQQLRPRRRREHEPEQHGRARHRPERRVGRRGAGADRNFSAEFGRGNGAVINLHDQVGDERRFTAARGSTTATPRSTRATSSPPARAADLQPVRCQHRRPDHQEQDVLLRLVRGHAQRARPAPTRSRSRRRSFATTSCATAPEQRRGAALPEFPAPDAAPGTSGNRYADQKNFMRRRRDDSRRSGAPPSSCDDYIRFDQYLGRIDHSSTAGTTRSRGAGSPRTSGQRRDEHSPATLGQGRARQPRAVRRATSRNLNLGYIHVFEPRGQRRCASPS